MKVKNEYIQIKVGDKTWTKKNMILNEYLYRTFDSQINEESQQKLLGFFIYLRIKPPLGWRVSLMQPFLSNLRGLRVGSHFLLSM